MTIDDKEALTRNPRDFKQVDERIAHAVRYKNFLTRRPYENALLQDGEALIAAVTQFAKDTMPLLQFGWDVLGEELVAE